jgi:hypothetical protein
MCQYMGYYPKKQVYPPHLCCLNGCYYLLGKNVFFKIQNRGILPLMFDYVLQFGEQFISAQARLKRLRTILPQKGRQFIRGIDER